MWWSFISSQTVSRHRNGGMRGEKWVGKEEGSCATLERRRQGSERALRWDVLLPKSIQLHSVI